MSKHAAVGLLDASAGGRLAATALSVVPASSGGQIRWNVGFHGQMKMHVGFPPIVGQDAKLVVLGSMPGAASLRAAQYYAHPRNSFWPIMGALFGADTALPYDERLQILILAGVAVWDVLQSCDRIGSLDSAITDERPNDFAAFFAEYRSIELVFFNGVKAEQAFTRQVLPTLTPPRWTLRRLPSTSPAHAGMSFQRKLDAWRVVAACAGLPPERPVYGR